MTTRDEVMGWVCRYEDAWRAADVSAVAGLFTADVRYARSPYDDPPLRGHAAVEEFWSDDTSFEMTVALVAVEGRDAVVRVTVRYEPPTGQEYCDLWVLRFAADGRVEDFEEWAYWPGRPYTAEREAK